MDHQVPPTAASVREVLLKLQMMQFAKAELHTVKEDLREILRNDVNDHKANLDRHNKRFFSLAAVVVSLLIGGDVWAFREVVSRLESQYSAVANREIERFRAQSSEVLQREVGAQVESIARQVTELTQKIADADKQLQQRLAAASQVAERLESFSGRFKALEADALQIAKLKEDVAGHLNAVRVQVDGSLRELADQRRSLQEQQRKLVDTGELVRALFSKPVTAIFHPKATPAEMVVVPHKNGNATVYFLLKETPIEQTIQLQYHIYVQPKTSYSLVRYGQEPTNIIGFRWGQAADSLNQHPMTITYVGDPVGGKQRVVKTLSVKGDVAYADGDPLPALYPQSK